MVKSNQFEIYIPPHKIQDAYDTDKDDSDLNMKNSDFLDNWQEFASWACTRYAGKNVIITIQVVKP